MSFNKLPVKKSKVLLIGSGRLATHLQFWAQLHSDHIQLSTWDRHQDPQRIQELTKNAQIVWLAISDDAIQSFYENKLQGFDLRCVHFSGRFHHNEIISCHPLMTFGPDLYEEPIVYSKIPFALTGADDLTTVLPGFKNPFFHLKAEKKDLYHALCVIAGNFPQILWNETEKTANQHQIPFDAFEMLCRHSLENFFNRGPSAMTGPFVRRDHQTIQSNIASLENPLQSIYEKFKQEFLK